MQCHGTVAEGVPQLGAQIWKEKARVPDAAPVGPLHLVDSPRPLWPGLRMVESHLAGWWGTCARSVEGVNKARLLVQLYTVTVAASST